MRSLSVAALGLILVVLSLFLPGEAKITQEQDDLYCEMVELYNASEGVYGWPDYKGLYLELCKGPKP